MKKHSLSTKGLSLSQAQSISNLCNQRSNEINFIIQSVNNASKVMHYEHHDYTLQNAYPMPENIVDLILEKGLLSSTQAFLMENIKSKEILLNNLRKALYYPEVNAPKQPDYIQAEVLSTVDENWEWGQLSIAETNEYLEAEAYASHIGQFIHKNSPLENLRKELKTIEPIQWKRVDDSKHSPVMVKIHHTPTQLHELHEKFAALHRKYEMRVNYFKAKIKNLVTEENARIAQLNADAQAEANKENGLLQVAYQAAYKEYQTNNLKLSQDFEKERQSRIKATAALRINVDARFQPVIDSFLEQID